MNKFFKKIGGGVVVVSGAVASTAHAALGTGVTTALGDAATDAATLGGLVLVAIVAASAFKYLRRGL